MKMLNDIVEIMQQLEQDIFMLNNNNYSNVKQVMLSRINSAKSYISSLNPEKKNINQLLAACANIVVDYTSVSIKDIKSKSRIREISDARQIFATIANTVLISNFEYRTATSIHEDVAKFINRDRCTVLHSIKAVNDVEQLRKKYNIMLNIINHVGIKKTDLHSEKGY